MVVTTTSQLIVRTPQYVEESTEGTTPTASPSFTACGMVKSLALKIDGSFVDISQIGPEDLVTILQGQQVYETSMVFTMTSSTFLKYGLNASNYATPAGTISAPLSILFSVYVNGTENYIILKGSRVKSCTLNMEVGKSTEVTFELVHKSISTPNSSHGLTTPTLSSAPSGTVWGWTDGGADPLSWNSAAQNCKKFSITINRNTKPDHTLGNLDPFGSQPHGRRISGDFTTLWTATTLEADFKAGTARTLAVVLKTATSTITVTSAKIVSYARDADSDSDEATVEQIGFRALSVTVS